MTEQPGLIPGPVDQLLGAFHRRIGLHCQVFVAHVGPHRLVRPGQQGLEGFAGGVRQPGEQSLAIVLVEPAQDGQQVPTGQGALQYPHDAAMQPEQQMAGTLRREGGEQGRPFRHGEGIEDAVELFRAQGQKLIGTGHRIQVVRQPVAQGNRVEQLMTIEQGVCFLHHRCPHVISGEPERLRHLAGCNGKKTAI